MSCLSRLFGLIFALVPGLGLLALSLLLVGRWPEVGLSKGVLYSLLSAITGTVCLYLGIAIVFARGRAEPEALPLAAAPRAAIEPPLAALEVSSAPQSPPAQRPLQAATLEELQSAPPTQSIFADAQDAAPAIEAEIVNVVADSPEARIRQVARTRPGWQGSAPQLAQLTNLSLGVTDATARSMAQNGAGVAVKTGAQGETIYVLQSPDQAGA